MAMPPKFLLLGLALALAVVSIHAAPTLHGHCHDHGHTPKLPHNNDSNQRRHPDESTQRSAVDSTTKTARTSSGAVTSERFPVGPMAEPGMIGGYGPRFLDDIIP